MAVKSCCRRLTSCCLRSIHDELLSLLAYLPSITPGIEDDLEERELSDGIPVEENVIQDDVSDLDIPLPLHLPNPVEVPINNYLNL